MTLYIAKINAKITGTVPLVILITLVSTLVKPVTPVGAQDLGKTLFASNLTSTAVESTTPGLPESLVSKDVEVAKEVVIPKPDKVVRAVMTAYTSTPDQTDDTPCITADGTNLCKTKKPTVAANWLPFGTKIKIPSLFGDQVFEVHDRMNKRYGYGRMDIWFDSPKAEAFKFGVKRADIEIYYVKKVPKEVAKR